METNPVTLLKFLTISEHELWESFKKCSLAVSSEHQYSLLNSCQKEHLLIFAAIGITAISERMKEWEGDPSFDINAAFKNSIGKKDE